MFKQFKYLIAAIVISFILAFVTTALTPNVHLGTALFIMGLVFLALLFSKLEDTQIKLLTGFSSKKTRR